MKRALHILTLLFVLALSNLSQLIAQWVQTNGSFPSTGFVGALAVNGTYLCAGTNGSSTGGAYYTTDNGASWVADANLGNPYIHAFAVNGSSLYAGTDLGVWRTPNIGATWTRLTGGGILTSAVNSLVFNDANLFAGASGGVYLSTNNGTNWTAVRSGLTDTIVYSLAFNGTNLFAGTYGGGAFLSSNNGASWTAVNFGLTNLFVNALAVIGTNVFAGTGGGVFLSTNNGTSWTAVTSGMTRTVFDLLAVGTNLFAGVNGGVYLSTNNGSSWTAVNSGLTSTAVYSLVINGMNLFAGARGAVWRRPLSEMVTSVKGYSTELPSQYTLGQNYPNPFNPSTSIGFRISSSGFIMLKVFDVLGREVAILVNENLNAGKYEATFDANGLASGIYFYRLQAGVFTEARKLVLSK